MDCHLSNKYGWCKGLGVVYADAEARHWCVFHAPVGKKASAPDEVTKLVSFEIDRAKGAREPCNLSGTVFESDVDFASLLRGSVDTDLILAGAEFNGNVDFTGVRFSRPAVFENAVFKARADFTGASFGARADFSGASFAGAVHFLEAAFLEPVGFKAAEFNGPANFCDASFAKPADFSNASFNAKAHFALCTFHAKTVFHKTAFEKDAFFTSLALHSQIRFEAVRLGTVSFADTDLSRVDFIDCEWPKRGLRDVVCEELKLDEEWGGRVFLWKMGALWGKNWKDLRAEIKRIEALYRGLKEKYMYEKNSASVSNWHYGEKEMERKGGRVSRFFPLSFLNLYWLSSGYNERPLRAGIALACLTAILASVMFVAGLVPAQAGAEANLWNAYLSTLQHVTFEKEPLLKPATQAGESIKMAARVLIPLQTVMLALSLKNRFRR